MPVIVITGETIRPKHSEILSKADISLEKPIKTVDLVSAIQDILKTRKDPHWAALEILDQLEKIDFHLQDKLGFFSKMVLKHRKNTLRDKILDNKSDIIGTLIKIGDMVTGFGVIAIRITTICKGFK